MGKNSTKLIIGDSFKFEVHKDSKIFRKETVYGWLWVDMLTEKIVGYILLGREIRTNDIKESFTELVEKWNPEVIHLDHCILITPHLQHFTSIYTKTLLLDAYNPAAKACIEGIIKKIKDEHDIRITNQGIFLSNKIESSLCTL